MDTEEIQTELKDFSIRFEELAKQFDELRLQAEKNIKKVNRL